MPKASAAPPNASYSGILECPCTDRIVKNWSTTYTTAITGTCASPVYNSTECFEAIKGLGASVQRMIVAQSSDMPSGCVMYRNANGTVNAVFNTADSSVQCGSGGTLYTASVPMNVTQVTLGIQLNTTAPGGQVTITVTGPSAVWFGVAFGASEMSQTPNAVIIDGYGNVTERKLGDHDAGNLISTQVIIGCLLLESRL